MTTESYPYRKTTHPKSPEDGQGWAETEVNDTLNAFDGGETRTPTLVVEKSVFENHSQDTRFRPLGEVCQTVLSTFGTGGNNQPLVVEPYQSLEEGGCSLMGEDVSPTLVSRYETATGNTQEKLNVVVKEEKAYGLEPGAAQRMNPEGRVWEETSPTIRANMGDNQASVCCLNDQGGSVMSVSDDKTATLRSEEHGHQPIVCYGVDCYNQTQTEEVSKALSSAATDSDHVPCTYGVDSYNQSAHEEVAETVRTNGGGDNLPKVCIYGQNGFASFGDGVSTLRAHGGDFGGGTENLCVDTYQETTGTLCAAIAKGTSNQIATDDMLCTANSVVRRLTPKECERLQGYEDDWTSIGEWVDSKGKKHKDADGPRYKALGNSIALPFWAWLAERIVKQLKEDGFEHPTMASLFDGIGGFPVVFSKAGCEPIWASEIEEFPIAVTKTHFPECEKGDADGSN